MLIPEITEKVTNNIKIDQYNRPSTVLLVNKPAVFTSHDIVDIARKFLRTKKVGHAGALDPFATGLLILLIGKYTKYTNALIALDKSYKAEIILGVKTLTQDPEGKLLAQKDVKKTDLADLSTIEKTLKENLAPSYEQYVPIFSSVKIEGQKLRKLARQAQDIKFLAEDEVEFTINKNEKVLVELPRKIVRIDEIKCHSIEEIDSVKLDHTELSGKFVKLTISVACSKGTYIRQLAEDIGKIFKLPAFLIALERTSVGQFSLESAIELPEIYDLALDAGIQEKPLAETGLEKFLTPRKRD